MSNVLILGANGGIARHATDLFLKETQARLTLCLRNAARLKNTHPERMRIIECDVLDLESLKTAMAGQDVVYANLAGDLERMARNIVKAMDATGLKRLIFISSMGIYDEVPGEKYGSILEPYRRAAAVIEASDLDYTILRPAWFTHDDETDYQTTQKGQPFKGSQVSRKSVAALVVKLAETPGLEVRRSLGVSKPG
ncbi:NAD-dependent epimerase/dehydratase family protein [Corallococcus praedator]|uniref:NAD-dependent epimerase/dehydratase family protein n=1 Tax=Corallococcus praedator TaxID=2316724 RepID=A0ABX9QIV8_9BACT|nr:MULTISPECIES: SDR family oxidoreductase [Corallococcus]RKH30510.1 NAD-dependent epimerase/dehydratase family protein [Corallococcus sp. CA031C]RKI06956.1 NAD-dependent epimerase/dehydratase family protein [Corallococcus praedator]